MLHILRWLWRLIFPIGEPVMVLGTIIGTRRRLRVPLSSYRSHGRYLGLTGTGKTGYILTQLVQFALNGQAFSLLDPHSDAAEDCLSLLISAGIADRPDFFDKFWFIELRDDADKDGYYLPFNVIKRKPGQPRHVVSARVLDVFHRTWRSLADGHAPSFDVMVRTGVKVLQANDLPLPNLYPFLLNREVRQTLLEKETDEEVLTFYQAYFDKLPPREQSDQIQSTIRRLMLLLDNPALRYSLGMQDCLLDFERIMDEGITVLYSLGGVRDHDARHMLAGFITKGMEDAALGRASNPNRPRRDHWLFIDEAAAVVQASEAAFRTCLSEVRKYKLWLQLIFQDNDQVSRQLAGSLANARFQVIFGCSPEDAGQMSRHLFSVDPMQVKAEAKTPTTQDVYMDTHSQWEQHAENLRSQPDRHCWIRIGNTPAVQVRSIDLPASRIPQDELVARREELKAEFRRRLMKTEMETIGFQSDGPQMVGGS